MVACQAETFCERTLLDNRHKQSILSYAEEEMGAIAQICTAKKEITPMDREASETPGGGTRPALPAPEPAGAKSGRYDFEVPDGLAVSDLLAVQLADCARLVRSLSDQAVDPRLEDLERLRTIQSLSDVVTASGDLAECIDRMHGGFGWRDQPAPRKKMRKP